jgi:hypothetical protein
LPQRLQHAIFAYPIFVPQLTLERRLGLAIRGDKTDRLKRLFFRIPEPAGLSSGLGALHQEGVCMPSVRKEEARRAILSEYEGWAKKHPDDAIMMGGFLFFRYLQNERSDLLDFRAAGSKWQIVHGWLQDRVKD